MCKLHLLRLRAKHVKLFIWATKKASGLVCIRQLLVTTSGVPVHPSDNHLLGNPYVWFGHLAYTKTSAATIPEQSPLGASSMTRKWLQEILYRLKENGISSYIRTKIALAMLCPSRSTVVLRVWNEFYIVEKVIWLHNDFYVVISHLFPFT